MRATEFVDSYFNAWNQRDAARIADHLAADGIYRDIPENQQRSQVELITSLSDFFSRYRHRYELIGEIVTGTDTIAFQYRMWPSDGNGQKGASSSYRGAEFMTLQGDAAMSITDYYDMPLDIQRSKYAKSGLTDAQLVEIKQRLDQTMRSERVYLQSNLTLPKLAKFVGCSVNHVSQAINAGFGISFFDYLNQYRIQHAKTLLTAMDGRNHAILNIAFNVGFNSNSAFYTAFKKSVGQTPAQYRRNSLNAAH